MPSRKLAIFDPNITVNSPAGSCLLKLLQSPSLDHDLEIFTVRTDLKASARITIQKMPVPMKPVFLQSICFTFASIFYSRFASRNSVKISTQGGYPFCHISYAHCCHKLFLTRYRGDIGGGPLTRLARLVNHKWSAVMESIAFRRASIIVVPSQGLANELTSAYGPAVEHKLRVIANPVDCELFACDRSTNEAFTFSFCALGNFEWKGLGLIIEALASGVPGILQVIGGSNAEIAPFQSLAKALGVGPRVTFIGFQKDIRPALWRSDVFVFPSVYETFPLVCLQAAAAGLPLIATPLYGLERLLQPGVSGWRIDRTVESLAIAMKAAVSDPAATARLGGQARQLAQMYDTGRFQDRWISLLHSL